ncbi:MAG: hypothetical protein M3Y72_22895 [Acidobacteriota bacterium]|nr:hypothetical protein [Acidobacteriota bacterium]
MSLTNAMRKILAGFIALATFALAAQTPERLPFCENVVQPVSFNPQGNWIITGVAAKSESYYLGRVRLRRLLGAHLRIEGTRARFSGNRFMSWKQPFPTPVLGQETYDTQSREFWLDFITDPKDLNLPRYVSAVDVELGTMLATGKGPVFFEFSGVWFRVVRAGSQSS